MSMSSNHMDQILSIPPHPPSVILPLPNTSQNLSLDSIETLEKLCRAILETDKIYSITFAQTTCPPPGTKNDLYNPKPDWDQVGEGNWRWKDGRRFPNFDKTLGVDQLTKMAKTVHLLSLGATKLPDDVLKSKCISKINQLLKVFFIDPETRMLPQVLYSQCDPLKEGLLRGDEYFVTDIRHLILVDQAIRLLRTQLDRSVFQGMRQWLSDQVNWMNTCLQGREAKSKKTFWYYAVTASHISVIAQKLSPSYASRIFTLWISAHPSPQEAFSEAISWIEHRRHRCLFTLEPMTILACLSRSSDNTSRIPEEILIYVEGAIDFAKTVEEGTMETVTESDARYFAKLKWFERVIQAEKNRDDSQAQSDISLDPEQLPDGSAWEKGWDERMKLLWELI